MRRKKVQVRIDKNCSQHATNYIPGCAAAPKPVAEAGPNPVAVAVLAAPPKGKGAGFPKLDEGCMPFVLGARPPAGQESPGHKERNSW